MIPRRESVNAEVVAGEGMPAIVRRMLDESGARSRTLRLRQGAVHLVEHGQGAPLLHLHGSTTSALSHVPLIERMPTIRSIAVDRPGHGLSEVGDLPPERYRKSVVAFLDDLLDALGLPVVALAGGSMGGAWSLWYALDRAERVSHLAVLGATPLLPGTRAPLPLRLASVGWVDALLARLFPPTTENIIRFMTVMGEGGTITRHPHLLESLAAGARSRTTRRVDREELGAILGVTGFKRELRFRPEELRELRIPVLMVWGDRDPVGGVDVARSVAALMGDVRLEVMPAGHVPWLGHPDRVAELLTDLVA